MTISDFVASHFLEPIKVEQGYNYTNTITYAITAFLALWLFSKFFRKHKTRINMLFLFSLLPFIAVGSIARVLVDKEIVQRTFWMISPGIYLTITSLFVITYFISYEIEKKFGTNRMKFLFSLGLFYLITLLIFSFPFELKNLGFALLILATVIAVSSVAFIALNTLKLKWATRPLAFSALSAQIFDSIITSSIIQFFGGWEKHPLPRAVIEHTGTAFSFFPLKLFVVLIALFYISKEVEDKYFRNILLVSIALLGLAQGLRNILGFVIA